MSLLEYAKRAAVRRVVYVLVGLCLAAFGIGNARAAVELTEGGREYHSDEGSAYAACMAQVSKAQGIKPTWSYFVCERLTSSPVYKSGVQYEGEWICTAAQTSTHPKYRCNATTVGFVGTDRAYYWWRVGSACPVDQPPLEDGTCAPTEAQCLARGSQVGTWEGDGSGQAVCSEGCVFVDSLDPSSPNGITYDPTGARCSAGDYPEPAPFIDTDGDGVADDDDAFPNDPGETTDTDGDGVGDNGDTAPGDPDNGEDGGTGDETDNTASGGGTCASPPTCSGDGIQCAQLFQQWKIRCALGGTVTGSPEVCEASYTCTGDSVQCASIALLRKTACAGAVGGSGAADEILQGLSNGPADQSVDPMNVWQGDVPGDDWEADESGFLSVSRTCPPPPTFTFGGHTKTIDTGPLCDLTEVVAAMVMLMAAAHALWAFTRG